MNKFDFEKFVDFYFSRNSYGQAESVNFQLAGFSADTVKKYWRKMHKFYNLPRAKRIEKAIIYFN